MDLPRLESQIRQAEGIRLVAYRDSLGLWTAGVGHLLDQGCSWEGQRFSLGQVAAWLEDDLITAQKLSNGLLEWPAMDTDARQNALIELVFNMGLSHWKQFVMARKAMSEKNWPEASKQLLSSLWAKQVGPIRSNRIAKMILSGEFA